MLNLEPNFDPSLPAGVDLQSIGLEDYEYCPECLGDMEDGVCEDCSESLSECCGASYIGETTLCSDCKEYG